MAARKRSRAERPKTETPETKQPGLGQPEVETPSRLSLLREPVNSLTHFFGVLAAVAATVTLLLISGGGARALLSFAIYGFSSILLFSASTLLHAVRAGPNVERWFRRLDHAAIFVLIAGSYTPIALVAMQPRFAGWGWTLFGVVWGVALAGVLFKLLWITAPRWLSTGLYLAMGWLVVAAIVPVARSLGTQSTIWLAVGGLFYTVGAFVYAAKRPDPVPGVFGYHEIWHLFVLAGWGAHLVIMVRLAAGA